MILIPSKEKLEIADLQILFTNQNIGLNDENYALIYFLYTQCISFKNDILELKARCPFMYRVNLSFYLQVLTLCYIWDFLGACANGSYTDTVLL